MRLGNRISRRRIGVFSLTVGILGAFVAGCGSSGGSNSSPKASAPPTKVTIATASTSAAQALVYLAEEQGLFAKNGIDASVSTSGAATVNAAISGGSLDYAVYGAPSPEILALQGAPVEWVMQWAKTANEQLVVGPGITSICQLKGQPVGFTSVGSLSEVFMQLALQKCKLSTQDVKLVPTQSNTEQSATFASGRVAATVFGPPASSEAVSSRKGASILYNFAGHVSWPSAGLVANKNYAEAHPQVTVDIIKSLFEAVQVYRTNKAAAEKAINAENGNTLSAADLETAYLSAKGYLTDTAEPTVSLERSVIGTLRELGTPFTSYADVSKASSMFNDTYVEQAARSLNIALSR